MTIQCANPNIRLYLDENISPRIAEQFRRRGVDAISARDIATLGVSDPDHLSQAIAMERVLVTSDSDFLRLAAAYQEHPGIVFGIQAHHTIGDWVKNLEMLSLVYSTDEMKNHVEYL